MVQLVDTSLQTNINLGIRIFQLQALSKCLLRSETPKESEVLGENTSVNNLNSKECVDVCVKKINEQTEADKTEISNKKSDSYSDNKNNSNDSTACSCFVEETKHQNEKHQIRKW